jgi:hypothetical protein
VDKNIINQVPLFYLLLTLT